MTPNALKWLPIAPNSSERIQIALNGFKWLHIRLYKYSQMLGWCLVHHGKCCVYAKKMFSQNFRINENKLAQRRAYLVYKGKSWYNGAKPKKIEFDFLGRKIYQYCPRVYQTMRNSNIGGGGGGGLF